MPKTLDVYRDWLQIQEPARPLSHYQLLRLKSFEDDMGKIREHYRKMNSHVRKFSAGEFAQQSQTLLNELAKAMLCLTDARRKREYDATLGRKDEKDDRRRSLAELLLARKILEPPALDKARKFADTVGVELRDAILQQKLAKAEDVMPAYAESIGLPYIDLADILIDESLVRQVPSVVARQHSCVPVMIDNDVLLMASPNAIDPQVEEHLRLRFSMPVRSVLCTPASVNVLVTKYYSREAAEAESAAAKTIPAAAAKTTAITTDSATAKPAEAKPAAAPDTPEAKKQRLIIAFMISNFSIMIYEFALQVMGNPSWGKILLGIPLYLAIFGSVWASLNVLKK